MNQQPGMGGMRQQSGKGGMGGIMQLHVMMMKRMDMMHAMMQMMMDRSPAALAQ